MSADFEKNKWEQSLDRLLRVSRKGIEQEMTTQARGLLKGILGITPPMSSRGGSGFRMNGTPNFAKGRDAILTTMAADLHRVFVPVQDVGRMKKQRRTPSFETYLSLRDAKRNVPPQPQKIFINQRDFGTFFDQLKKRMGLTASGWVAAVQKLGGVRLPAWITGKSGRGSAELVQTDKFFFLSLKNMVGHTDDPAIQGRVTSAIKGLTKRNEARARDIATRTANAELKRKIKMGATVKL